jgi:putative NADPH-quinone reductase
MNVLVILGHPDPDSFNHALAAAACGVCKSLGHRVVFHDLYAERFDPLLPAGEIPEHGLVPEGVDMHCRELRAADMIVVVHPNWWGQPPAILKGWIDRVIRPGVAYRFENGDDGEGVPIGLLPARAVVVLNTSNTPDQREQMSFGDPLQLLWQRCIFDLCGVRGFYRKMFNVVVTSMPKQREIWLAEARALVTQALGDSSGKS